MYPPTTLHNVTVQTTYFHKQQMHFHSFACFCFKYNPCTVN